MKRALRTAWILAGLAMAVVLVGCLGSAPPVEQYLRVEPAPSPCGKISAVPGRADHGVVAFKELRALDNLDRPAVLFADGSVLAPSLRWYWEGTPGSVMTMAVTQAVACLPGVTGVAAYRPRVGHDALMSGEVTAFNVQKQGGLRFVAAVRMEVWTRDQMRLVARGEFRAEVPMPGETAADIATAATTACGDIGRDVAAWMSAEKGGVLGQVRAMEEKNQ